MRFKIIPLEDKQIVYFPDSLRFFETNSDTVEILKEIELGKTYEYFYSKYQNFDQNDYERLKGYCTEVAISKVEPEDINSLFRLVLNISNVCNMNCRYCYAGGGNYGDKEALMDIDILDKVLCFFYKFYKDIEVIQLFGGEPTLNIKAIEYTCKYIKENNKHTIVSMVTNGTNLNDRLIDLISKYNIYVTASIDCSELHNYLRPFNSGEETYELIICNLNKLYHKTGQPGQIEVTYTRQHDIKGISIQNLLESLNKDLDFEVFAHIAPVCTENADYKLNNPKRFFESIDDYYKYLGTDKQMHYSYIDRFLKPLKEHEPSIRYCGAGVGTIAVDIYGNIYPCFYFVNNNKFLIGNVVTDSYEKIQHNLTNTQKEYSNYKRNETEKCKECFANTICYGCIGANYSITGDAMLMSDFHCEWVKKGLEATLKNIVKNKHK